MLVITRKYNQGAVIEIGGKTLTVTVSKAQNKSGCVRLVFDGPRDFHVLRQELEREVKDVGVGFDTQGLGESSSDCV